MSPRACVRLAAAAVSVLALMPAAKAQSVADFYKGKSVDLYIGYSAGGAYDIYARMLARFMGKHIPGNPTIVTKNMAGAGSLLLANWLYNVAPKDGSAIGIIGRGTGFDPILGNKRAQFEGPKFLWLGSANNEVSVCVAWHTAGVTRFEDLLTKELVVGGTGASADTDQFPKITNGVLGTRFKIVTGYPGGNEVNLAMERGELQGRASNSWASWKSTRPQWVKEKKLIVLVQVALKRDPELKDVPTLIELVKTERDRKFMAFLSAETAVARSLVAPPDVPADRLNALRRAFDKTVKDPQFLAEAAKAGGMDIQPMTGEEAQKIAHGIVNTPPEVIDYARQVLGKLLR